MAKRRKDGGMIFRIEPAKTCCECGRELDSRMLNNPYGAWSIPVVDGATGETRCTYCDEKRRGYDAETRLTPGCEALKQLKRWLSVPPEERVN